MPTYNQMQAQVVRAKWQGKLMTCIYNDKERIGVIKRVKQGPAIQMSDGEYNYLNEPNGKVYVDFHQTDGKKRCFMWVKVVNPQAAAIITPKSGIVRARAEELGIPLLELSLVRRMPKLIE